MRSCRLAPEPSSQTAPPHLSGGEIGPESKCDRPKSHSWFVAERGSGLASDRPSQLPLLSASVPSSSGRGAAVHGSSCVLGFLFYMWFQLLHFSPNAPGQLGSSSPLSFRSVTRWRPHKKAQAPGVGMGAPASHSKGNFYPPYRASSGRILVLGLPPPARSVARQSTRAQGLHRACLVLSGKMLSAHT